MEGFFNLNGISLKYLWRYWKSFLVLGAHLALEAVFLPLLKAPVASSRSWRQLESTGKGHLKISWKEVQHQGEDVSVKSLTTLPWADLRNVLCLQVKFLHM